MKLFVIPLTVFPILFTANVAFGKTAAEIRAMARSSAVEIKLQQDSSQGSGLLINRQGNLYTILTNRHVVCGLKWCSKLKPEERYTITTADGLQQVLKPETVKILGNELDLAILQFRSPQNYPIVTIAQPDSLKAEDIVYASGFPARQPWFRFEKGKIAATANKRLVDDQGGYTVVYNANTLPGMSGGGVFNVKGELVAIHGQGYVYRANTEVPRSAAGNSQVYQPSEESKIGYNRGIAVKWLLPEMGKLGFTASFVAVGTPSSATTADEHFIIGFNKFVSPGQDVKKGKQEALQEFTKAIEINPQYATAFHLRARIYWQFKQYKEALADYDQAITISPIFDAAYINRGVLKADAFRDLPAAMQDLNQAVKINPNNYLAYFNRALVFKLSNEPVQAMNDYNKAVAINPLYAQSYSNRGVLKYELNNPLGALADYNTAINIESNDAPSYNNRGNVYFYKLRNYSAAVKDYDKAIQLEPDYANAYFNRGNLKYYGLSDKAGGIKDMEECLRLANLQGRTDRSQAAQSLLQQWRNN
jgi:tetratricopeptide (TPR) repeat protein